MKKTIVLFTFMIFLGTTAILAQEADKIVEKHFKTINQDKLSDVKTIVMKGNVVQAGMEFPFTIIQKRPDKAKMVANVQGMEIIQAYNGETAWMVMPMMGSEKPQEMDENQTKTMKEMANLDGDLYQWKKKGYDLNYEGEDDIDGIKVHKIRLTKENGDEFVYYIGADDYLIRRTDTQTTNQGMTVNVSTNYSGHDKVDGIIFPFMIESTANGQTISTIDINSYDLDSDVEDTTFEMPDTTATE